MSPQLNKSSGQIEWSVCRTAGLTSEDLWKICSAYVDRPGDPAKARASFKATDVTSLGLSCHADGKPHVHHVNILGWPDLSSKDRIKNLQQKIAAAMTERLEMRAKT